MRYTHHMYSISAETEIKDLVTSYLKEDTRILASVLAQSRIYRSESHEVFLCIYSGLLGTAWLSEDLVTCLVYYKKEKIRVMFKLWTAEIQGERTAYLEQCVGELERQGKTPFHLIRDGKNWCHLPFTSEEQEALRATGVPPA